MDTYIWTLLLLRLTPNTSRIYIYIYIYVYIYIYIYIHIYICNNIVDISERNQYDGQDLLAEKTLSVTLHDINITRVKFELAAPNLMKSNRITAEEQDKGKLGKLYSERKACRQKWLAILCFIRKTNVHYMVLMFEQLW